jgi:beta-lactamase regulating signal transducer with metallopeptidase domain
MRLLKLLSVSTIVLLTLNIFNVISISYLWFLIPLFILPIVFLFSKFLNFKNIFKQLDTDLTKIGIEISEKLNSMGYNIKTTQGIIKNDKKIIIILIIVGGEVVFN